MFRPGLLLLLCVVRMTHSFDPADVNLMLYSPSDEGGGDPRVERVVWGDESTLRHLRGKPGMKVVAHGFGTGGNSSWIAPMTNRLVEKGFDVMVIDWGKLSAAPYYETAKLNTVFVGQYAAQVLTWISDVKGILPEDFHIIGFSLGAHVAGIIGHHFQPRLPGRVTGLDAAYPLYENEVLEKRLDESDGQFVDVIHTNGGTLFEAAMAFYDPLGHVDFYPNGGKKQVGCVTYAIPYNHYKQPLFYYPEDAELSCSHHRSVHLFIESIENPMAFPSQQCIDYQGYQKGHCILNARNPSGRMGFWANSRMEGKHFLTTRTVMPFHGKEFNIQIQINPQQEKTMGKITVQFHTENMTDGSVAFDGTIRGDQTIYNMMAIAMNQLHLLEVTYDARASIFSSTLSIDQVQVLDTSTGDRYYTGAFILQDGHSFVTRLDQNR